MNLEIRKITEMADIYKILDLMKVVWLMDDREVAASFEMKAFSQFGLLLGAYNVDEDNNKPIGFLYVVNKFPDIHYSHMMGIDPRYQGQNIGFILKKHHREIALQATNPIINSVQWTVDPLLSINANLNFRKLGVICNTYEVNFYGTPDNVGLYPSLPTDRILVSWLIRSPRVEKRYKSDYTNALPWNSVSDLINDIPALNKYDLKGELLNYPNEDCLNLIGKHDKLTLEIPADFTKLSRTNYEWALNWRLASRKIFMKSFESGYYLVDYISFKEANNTRRNFYIFTRNVNDYKY